MADPTKLEVLRDRVEVHLVDGGNRVWASGTLDESIRLALADLSGATGAVLTIGGLDGATATTLEVRDESTLVVGAAGYAARSRAIQRGEMASLSQDLPGTLAAWANDALAKFDVYVKVVKLRTMRETSSAPHGAMTWTEEPESW